MSFSENAQTQPPDEKAILPFNPPGTFAPGTFAPGSSAPGVVTVLAPSYPLQTPTDIKGGEFQRPVSYALPAGAAQPGMMAYPGIGGVQQQQLYPSQATPFSSPQPAMTPQIGVGGMQHEQLYAQASFPPQAVVAHPRSATMPTMTGGLSPQPTGAQTWGGNNPYYYAGAGGVTENSRAATMPAGYSPVDMQQREPQFQMTTPQQAITTQQNLSMPAASGYFGAVAQPPFVNTQFDQQVLAAHGGGGHLQSPTWSPGSTTITDQFANQNMQSAYPPSPQSPVTQSSYSTVVMQQASYVPANTAETSPPPPPPYKDEQVPALTTTPRFNWTKDEGIVSNDQLLNTNGDALYRFILDHMDLPKVRLHCYGSHVESTITARAGKAAIKETTIIDFNFMIDLSLSMNCASGELYTFGNNILAFRGKMDKEVGEAGGPQSIRDWTRSYAESAKTGKKFKFYKAVAGLDMPNIRDAVDQIINSTGHTGHRNVYFTVTNSSIKIHPDSTLMMLLTNPFLKFLLWLVLAYPFIWMYRRYGKEGGKWDVCRASYACNRDPRNPPNVVGGVPLGGGDWVKIWERTIRLGVGNNIRTSQPIYRPTANDSGVIVFD